MQFPGRSVLTARFTTDGDHLVILHSQAGPFVAGTGRIEVNDRRSGDVVRRLDTDAWYAVPSPIDALVAIGPRDEAPDQTVTMWDRQSGERVAMLEDHTGLILDLVFSVANREVRHEVLGERRPVLTVLVTDHWDESWLIEIEAIAARPVMGG